MIFTCNAVTNPPCPRPAVVRITSMCVHEHISATNACEVHDDRALGAACIRCHQDPANSHICLVTHVQRVPWNVHAPTEETT